jgi:hypothetical protein
VKAYPSDLPRLRSLIRRLAGNRLISSTGYDRETGRRIGGRPPVAAETFRALLDKAEANLLQPRATKGKERARRVDEAARVGFARLFGPRPTPLMPYRPSIEGVAARASGANLGRRWLLNGLGLSRPIACKRVACHRVPRPLEDDARHARGARCLIEGPIGMFPCGCPMVDREEHPKASGRYPASASRRI